MDSSALQTDRPWYRLHGMTLFASGVVAASFLFVNASASGPAAVMVHSSKNGMFFYRQHGWPVGFAQRTSPEGESVWLSPLKKFSFGALAVDLFLATAAILGTAWAVERWRRGMRLTRRFSLKTLFVVVAWAATCAAIARDKFVYLVVLHSPYVLFYHWLDVLFYLALALNHVALAFIWLAAFDLIGVGRKRLVQRRTLRMSRSPGFSSEAV